MRLLASTLCAAIALSLPGGAVAPAIAGPSFVLQAPEASANVLQVQERRVIRRDHRRSHRFERHRDRAYYRGHRGYRDYRPGYRRYNGWWFPSAAFIAGAIVGGALDNSRTMVRRSGSAHVQWCYDRWRSYRAFDNSYQPYNGPRRQCVSPYS